VAQCYRVPPWQHVAATGAAQGIGNWSLTSLQQRVVKTDGRLIRHAPYYWLLLAESHLTRRLFGGMLGNVAHANIRSQDLRHIAGDDTATACFKLSLRPEFKFATGRMK